MEATHRNIIEAAAAIVEHLDAEIAAQLRATRDQPDADTLRHIGNQLRISDRNPEPRQDTTDIAESVTWAVADQITDVRRAVAAGEHTCEVHSQLALAAQLVRAHRGTAAADTLVTMIADGANPEIVADVPELLATRAAAGDDQEAT